MSDHLGVCIRGKTGASQLELFTQIVMIFYDAIVNDRDAINRVRMRIIFVWTAVGCPARVADAYRAGEWLSGKLRLEVLEFSDCAPPRQETAFKRGDAG